VELRSIKLLSVDKRSAKFSSLRLAVPIDYIIEILALYRKECVHMLHRRNCVINLEVPFMCAK
jgi:hypothetical protein